MRKMNDQELHEAAVTLLQSIKDNKDGAYDEWMDLTKNKAAIEAHADWVQRAAGLTDTPSPEDLDAMCEYTAKHLQEHVANMQKVRPHAVGNYCGTQT